MKFASWIDSSFHKWFLCIRLVLCNSIWSTVELLPKLESVLSKPVSALVSKLMWCSKSFTVFSIIFTASSPGVDPVSENHFSGSSLRNISLSVKVSSWCCIKPATSSTSDSDCSSHAFPTTSTVTSSAELSNLSKSSVRAGVPCQTLACVGVLTFPQESWLFLMASTLVTPFQMVFNPFCHQRNHYLLWRQLLSFSLMNHLRCFTLCFCGFLTSLSFCRTGESRGLALH